MTPWVTPVVTLFVGLFAGWVASRNARKTPHENLKALTEIRASLGETAPSEQLAVLDASIAWEIQRIDELTSARGRGPVYYAYTRVRQMDAWPIATLVLSFAVFGIAIWDAYSPPRRIGTPAEPHWSNPYWTASAAVAGVLLIGVVAGIVLGVLRTPPSE